MRTLYLAIVPLKCLIVFFRAVSSEETKFPSKIVLSLVISSFLAYNSYWCSSSSWLISLLSFGSELSLSAREAKNSWRLNTPFAISVILAMLLAFSCSKSSLRVFVYLTSAIFWTLLSLMVLLSFSIYRSFISYFPLHY